MNKFLGSMALVSVFLFALGGADAGDEAGKKKKGRKGRGVFGRGNTEEIFKKLDANSDGKLTRDEFLKRADRITDQAKADKAREFMGKAFDRIAVDNAVTSEQFKKAAETFGRKKKKTSEV